MIRCCYKCERRYVGCHAECPEYIEAKEKHDALRDEEFRQNQGNCIATNLLIQRMNQTRRRKSKIR